MTSSAFSVTAAIADASRRTGVSAEYLQATAHRESGFNPQARAQTSSAAGLFQFIERTWLQTVERHGARLGLEGGADGAPANRDALLQMRFDPHAAALMAGALTRDNAEALEAALGRAPDAGELYTAHVLGAGDAARLLETAATAPATPAATLFPAAAAANRGLFYDADGTAVSSAALRDRFAALMTDAEAPAAAAPTPEAVATARAALRPAFSVADQPALRVTPQVAAILASLSAPEPAAPLGESAPQDRDETDRAAGAPRRA